ncbi:hypothetical protein [Fictibacillus sp. 26RED30]|uniref:hypothetical protein n=1 Tax=Fictibacillus sp. 26RED30 TaxID=2745877 RepID=UPI0018CE9ED6|nr:hypothetical protein [Fictibacillus sp. 26RED30]MBH0161855.1 hypothetical protein [Fictibacillus sp. 26RED30]
MTGETLNGAKRQVAHRLPRGKRAPETEINDFQSSTKRIKNEQGSEMNCEGYGYGKEQR